MQSDVFRVFTVALHAQLQRLHTLQHHPSVEWAHARACMANELVQVIIVERLRPQNCAAHASPLTVNMLGCGINDDVGTKF